MRLKKKTRTQGASQFVDTARRHLGTRLGLAAKSKTTLNNPYGERVGYPLGVGPGKRWDGAFLDVVARDSSVSLPSFVDPASALQYFIQRNRFYVKTPRPGDVVFFAYNNHVGLVSEVNRKNQTFKAIEAEVSSGLPRASKDPDGVFERTHSLKYEVIGFGRPDFRTRKKGKAQAEADLKKKPLVHPSNFQYGKLHKSTQVIQQALAIQDVERGRFDLKTRAAYAKYQRNIGYTHQDATGYPDETSLLRLAEESGLFRVRGASGES